MKAKGRKTTGTGRMQHLKDVQRRFRNGFQQGEWRAQAAARRRSGGCEASAVLLLATPDPRFSVGVCRRGQEGGVRLSASLAEKTKTYPL